MKRVIILLSISIFLFGCTTIPSGSGDFGPDKIGAVHYNAESLSFQEASYLYTGVGKKSMLMVSEFDTEIYEEAFGVDTLLMADGLYNQYLKINPGIHDMSIVSRPQGLQKGNTITITTIDLSFEFIPGHVYIFDHKDTDKINVLFWKIGSEETFQDEIKLSRSN